MAVFVSGKGLRRPVGRRANQERRRLRVKEGAAAGRHHVRASLCGCTATPAGKRNGTVTKHPRSCAFTRTAGRTRVPASVGDYFPYSPSTSWSSGPACEAGTRDPGANERRKGKGGERDPKCRRNTKAVLGGILPSGVARRCPAQNQACRSPSEVAKTPVWPSAPPGGDRGGASLRDNVSCCAGPRGARGQAAPGYAVVHRLCKHYRRWAPEAQR